MRRHRRVSKAAGWLAIWAATTVAMSVITQLADIYTGWMPTAATSLVLVGCWYWSVRTASRRAARARG
ncbi:hypothetical protein C8250_042785 [Streptomyces sp. So13.3]|uniref:hypothetical protein n=1 Tax=unclassified Streptomyces TaxID=2593676 RepID=UPI001106A489|nr:MULTISPECIES: hypothetical protein [unclassified Streptomyces]MCZ4102317.1 hypothetical protein [Streptomyces sp. H39-C1]QNA77600.1 hypothetical protein C8250_042785 [Streptomyces sp. So13.3]